MKNHTRGAWERYCLYHKDAIEDLRKRVVSNAEKKATSKEMDATAEAEVEGTASFTTRQVTQQTIPQQIFIQQAAPQQATSQQAVPQQAVFQQPALQRDNPRQETPMQPVSQQAASHQTANSKKIQPPPPCGMVTEPDPVVVKTVFLDEDQLDFAFAVEMLSKWNSKEESDASFWNRMDNMVGVRFSPRRLFVGWLIRVLSGPAPPHQHGRRSARSTGPGLSTSSQSTQLSCEVIDKGV